jgi:hypothetical protein
MCPIMTPNDFELNGSNPKVGYSTEYPYVDKGQTVIGSDGKPLMHHVIFNANGKEHISWNTLSDGSVLEDSVHYTPSEGKPPKGFEPSKLSDIKIPFNPDCLWD